MSKNLGPSLLSKTINHLKNRLLAGLLIIAPVGITFWILRLILGNLDELLKPVLGKALGVVVPGLGLLGLLAILYLTGLIVSNVLGRWLVGKGQEALMQLPLVKYVYSPVKQLAEAFSGGAAASFKRVVLVEYPRADCWAIAFQTGAARGVNGQPLAIVYVPGAPTPSSGWVAVFPQEQVHDTDLTVAEALNLVISGGSMAPSRITGILPGPHAGEKGSSVG